MLKLKDYRYAIPESLIAQYPLKKRDASRLMVVHRDSQTIVHDCFRNIGKYLPAQSMLVVNDSRVIPARLLGQRQLTGGQVEVFLLKEHNDGYCYDVLMKPLRRLKVGDEIIFKGSQVVAKVTDNKKPKVRFNRKDVIRHLNGQAHIPLPPYIKRPDECRDKQSYQTVYARTKGSVAAPTAGFHFTEKLMHRLKRKGHSFEKVTLHINYATFKPVEENKITKHKMHLEEYCVSEPGLNRLQKAQERGKAVVAVGTTSCRVLESVARTGKRQGQTDLFIYSGYQFQSVDHLCTNFHQPESTLLMLVSAFAGHALIQKAYREAIQKKYRFYSYGDAMLIL